MTIDIAQKYGHLLAGKTGTDSLMMFLQSVQQEEGHIPKEAFFYASTTLCVPLAEVYGVATFYNFFKLKKAGKHTIRVCDGTACHVQGGVSLLDHIKKTLAIEPGQVTADGVFSLEVVRCLGLCASAPVIMIDGQVYPKVTNETLTKVFADYRKTV